MGNNSFFDRIRNEIANSELQLALYELKDFLSGRQDFRDRSSTPSRFYNETLMLLGRLARSAADRRKGVSSSEDSDRTLAQIALATLELADELERSVPNRMVPIPQAPITLPDGACVALEKIIGPTSQLKSIWWLHQGLLCARSVCRLVTPRGIGTGFLINDCFLVTNNHVLGTANEAAETIVEFNFEEGVDKQLKEVFCYQLDPTTFHTSVELDCTTVRIEPNGEEEHLGHWGSLIVKRERTVSIDDHVTIIQHPQGGVKQICLTDNRVINIFGSKVQYTTDTMPGSSGSPVFDDEWRVIAIHHAGGNLVRNSRGDRIFANEGISMGVIFEHPEFRGLLQ